MSVADWLDLMPATVTVQTFVGRDSYGTASYGSPITFSARVTYKNDYIRVATGEQVVSRGHIWIATVEDVTVQDLITLPDGTTPPLLAVEQIADESGPLYTKVYFG